MMERIKNWVFRILRFHAPVVWELENQELLCIIVSLAA